jgi:GGDEF domain-containing protein/CHASE3 domain sensor protein
VNFSISKLTDVIPSALLEKLIPKELFARLDIASKMLLGYMVLVLLTMVVIIYALVSLQRLNILNSRIVTVDVPVQATAEKMREAIIGQDNYEKRYIILNSPDMRTLFYKRGEEFKQGMDVLQKLPDSRHLPLAQIAGLYKEYTDLFAKEVKMMRSGDREGASRISNGLIKKKSEKIMEILFQMSASATSARDDKMQRISFIGKSAFLMTAFLSILSVLLGVIGSMVVTYHISSSIKKLSVATGQIAEGNFGYDPQIKSNDEIGALATAFVEMGKRLKKLEEMYLDASPLTRLPGGIAIENVMKKRLETKHPIAFCMLDLDNFKSYNDRYGYAHGSELLKETAQIIERVVKGRGNAEDFIGHIGGDDFVVITVPDRMRVLGEEIITRFDRRIPDFYDETDRKNGYIMGKSRQGIEMKFPLMTISIAIVTNERRAISSPLEASEIAAELKDYAKTIPKSVFIIDKRREA